MPKPVFVADTSFLISVEVGGLIPKFLKYCEILIPKEIVEEIRDMSRYKDEEGLAAERILGFINKDLIKTKGVSKKDFIEKHTLKIGRGEAAVLELSKEINTDKILCDDLDALPHMKNNTNVPVLNTPFVIYTLYLLGDITKHQAENIVKKIVNIRGWEGSILKVLFDEYFK